MQVLWNVTLDPDRVFLSDATDEYIGKFANHLIKSDNSVLLLWFGQARMV